MDHGVQRQEPGDGQAAGLAARRWPAAPSAAVGARKIPTSSSSLRHPTPPPILWPAVFLDAPVRRSAESASAIRRDLACLHAFDGPAKRHPPSGTVITSPVSHPF